MIQAKKYIAQERWQTTKKESMQEKWRSTSKQLCMNSCKEQARNYSRIVAGTRQKGTQLKGTQEKQQGTRPVCVLKKY